MFTIKFAGRAGIGLFLFVYGAIWAESHAEDRITLVDAKGRTLERVGEIQSYDRRLMQLVGPNGQTSRIPASQVTKVETQYNVEHQRALELEQRREFAAALERYRAAYRDESRAWLKQELVARTIVCMHAEGDIRRAVSTFLALIKHDPRTRFRYVIPLPWGGGASLQRDSSFLRQARQWLSDEQATDAEKLLAAAWSLSGSDRAVADRILDGLGRAASKSQAEDAWISQLATAQRWRRQVVIVAPDQLERWRYHFRSLPDDLKSGPAFVLAQALARQRELDAAVVSNLQAALGPYADPVVAPHALWAASQLLQQLARPEEAKRLLEEIVADYADTPHAGPALNQLNRLR